MCERYSDSGSFFVDLFFHVFHLADIPEPQRLGLFQCYAATEVFQVAQTGGLGFSLRAKRNRFVLHFLCKNIGS